MIEFRTLGPIGLLGLDGQELRSLLSQPKRLALLAYLAVAGGEAPKRRDTLLGVFWPELDQQHARAALRKALYDLRTALRDGVLPGKGEETLVLDWTAIWCDVAEYESALRGEDWARALELYRGDFLEGFFLSDTPAFEQWMETERSRLRDLASDAALTLAERDGAGNGVVAKRYVRRALELSPDDEGVLRRAIVALDRAGNRAEAVAVYDGFSKRLAEEYEVEPSPETQELIDAVRKREASNGSPAASAIRDLTPERRLSDDVPSDRHRLGSNPKLVLLGALAAILVAVSAFYLLVLRERVPETNRVMVTVFENRTGDERFDIVGKMAADWITRAVGWGNVIPVVSPQTTLRYAPVSGIGEPTESVPTSVRALAENEGAEWVVWGVLSGASDTLSVDIRVGSVISDVPVRLLEPITAGFENPLTAIEIAARETFSVLVELAEPTLAAQSGLQHLLPTFEAYREFLIGIEQTYVARNLPSAREHLQRAVELDTEFSPAAVTLAYVYWASIVEPAADSIARLLQRTRPRLSVADSITLDFVRASVRGDLGQHYQSARRLTEVYPDDEFGWYNFVRAARDLGRYREVVDVLLQLDPTHDVYADHWGILVECYSALGEHEEALAVARKLRQEDEANQYYLMLEFDALVQLGRADEVLELVESIAVSPRRGWYQPATMLFQAGSGLLSAGYDSVGREVLESAVDRFRRLPAQQAGAWGNKNALAEALGMLGRLAEARTVREELVRYPPAHIDPEDVQYQVMNRGPLGVIAAEVGDRQTALATMQWLAAQDDPRLKGLGKIYAAQIAAILGSYDEAVVLIQESITDGISLPRLRAMLDDLGPLRDDPRIEELLAPRG